MLVMKRRVGETILIGDDIRIHITEIGRTRVKLAIEAPRRLAIVAQELKLTGDENVAAAANAAEHVRALAVRLAGSPKIFLENSRPDFDK
jgi:carbon storage regulator